MSGPLPDPTTPPGTTATVGSGAASRLMGLLPRIGGGRLPSEAALRALAGSADPALLCVVAQAGEVLFLSGDRAGIPGIVAAPTACGLFQPAEPAALDGAILDCARSGTPGYVCLRRRTTGGSRWLELRLQRLPGGRNPRVLVVARDITARMADEARARMLAEALDASPDAVVVTDRAGNILHVNAGFERQTGYDRTEVMGKSTRLLRSGKHRPEFYRRLWATILEGRPFRAEFVNQRRDGELYQIEQVVAPVRGPDGSITHFVAIGRDVGERKRLESEFEERAYFDPLTGLPGQRLFRERAKHSLALARRHAETAALLYIDLEGFRALSSKYGRAAGDEVLRAAADRLRQITRESDALARVTADEFLVLLSEVSDEDAIARVARRIREHLAQPLSIGPHSLTLCARIGIAVYPQDAGNYEELLTRADAALERASADGTEIEYYRPELSVHSREQAHLEEELRAAAEHDEFVLHFQPIVATESGHLVGAEALTRGQMAGIEALARWPHMQRIMAPAEFIPLAERTGKIVGLDRWAVSAAVRQATVWSERGWHGWISVNLSARSLEDPDLPRYIGRVLEAQKLDPSRLVLEITESAAVRDPETTARVLRNLKNVGARLAVDDFGIGQTSLAYLKHFPVDLLKLDQSFIRDIGSDPKDERLIEVMITLAHRIGAQIIAEGVEDEHQLLWLRAVGCDMVQGFLIGHPVPPEEVRTDLPLLTR